MTRWNTFHSSVPGWVRIVVLAQYFWARGWRKLADLVSYPFGEWWMYDFVDRHCGCEHCEARRSKGQQTSKVGKGRW